MKKILSMGLAVTMAMAALPVAYAAEAGGNWGTGTEVTYTNAAAKEEYTVTVPEGTIVKILGIEIYNDVE